MADPVTVAAENDEEGRGRGDGGERQRWEGRRRRGPPGGGSLEGRAGFGIDADEVAGQVEAG